MNKLKLVLKQGRKGRWRFQVVTAGGTVLFVASVIDSHETPEGARESFVRTIEAIVPGSGAVARWRERGIIDSMDEEVVPHVA